MSSRRDIVTRKGDAYQVLRADEGPPIRLTPEQVEALLAYRRSEVDVEVGRVADHEFPGFRLTTEPPEPTRANRGGQPMPVKGQVCVQDVVAKRWTQHHVADELVVYVEARKALGVTRYGRPLETFNGRDALVDAFEEAFDLVMYLVQEVLQRFGEWPDEYYPENGDPDALLLSLDLAEEVLRQLTRMLLERDGRLPVVAER